ncbi:MAG: lipid-A-disaccharide synthase [Acidobacteria bacterium]|nr:MAG: lipid-A-disaccharide synthase [Acidobacteriota bacterium]
MAEGLESLRLMVVAGEESGDAHAAALVRALRECAPATRFEFFGSTGARMREAGVESVVREDDLAITGLVEIARALPRFAAAYRALKRAALERRPDAVVLVDWPDFNLALARTLRRRGLKIIYYISPQLWAWRSHRVRQVRRDVDLMLTILPFERDWYAARGVAHVEFVGHPLAGRARPHDSRAEFCARHDLDPSKPVVALLPGSRRKEFERILPVMLDAAARVSQTTHGAQFSETPPGARFAEPRPGVQFVVALASRRSPEEAERVIAAHLEASSLAPRVRIVHDEAREALAAADAAAVCSGTATLEAALTGTPLIVVYKESALNWHTLGRLINVEHYGLVNLVAGERVAAELMQDDFNAASLARELLALLDPEHNARVRARLREATARLGEGGASLRAADAVLRAVREWKKDGVKG